MIELSKINFFYNGSFSINDLSIKAKKGVLTGLIGPNGSGKTTVLKIASGLLRPISGKVIVNGKSLHKIKDKERARSITYVMPAAVSDIIFTVKQIVEMGRYAYSSMFIRNEKEKSKEIINNAIELLELTRLKQRPFFNLSAGEQQRVLIASAVAQETSAILFDEPGAHIDIHFRTEIFSLIKNIVKEKNMSSFLVTHDINSASLFCDYLYIMVDGKIVSQGTPDNIINEDIMQNIYGKKIQVIRDKDNQKPFVLPKV